MKLRIIGKNNNPWIKSLAEHLPKETEARTIVLIGAWRQYMLSLIMKFFLFDVIWIGDAVKNKALAKVAGFFAKKIIVPNQAIEASYLRAGISSEKLRLIYPPMEIVDEGKNFSGQIIIGGDASLSIENGIGTILRAASSSQEILQNIRIIIGGAVHDKGRIEWMSKELNLKDAVQCVPSDKHTWMQSAHIYILPIKEGQLVPISILGAMASKCAVIASDVLANHEFIEQNKNGVLVEPNNSEMLSQAIIYLARRPEWIVELGQNNYNFAKEKFSKDSFQKQISAIL